MTHTLDPHFLTVYPFSKKFKDKIKTILKKYFPHLYHPPNTIKRNLKAWSNYDWSGLGERWTYNPEWKRSLVEDVLKPFIPRGSCVLEIGPGAGRWTEYLAELAGHLTLVDLAPICIEICKERFKDYDNIEYVINDGKDLSFIPENSIDRIWSYDVFVHIRAKDVRDYVREFAKVLSPGGYGMIHHSKRGKDRTGWRSNMSAEKMRTYCGIYGLRVIRQFNTWSNGRFRTCFDRPEEKNCDIISVFSKETKIIEHP